MYLVRKDVTNTHSVTYTRNRVGRHVSIRASRLYKIYVRYGDQIIVAQYIGQNEINVNFLRPIMRAYNIM